MVSTRKITPESTSLFFDILPRATNRAFARCSEIGFFSRDAWYLAGGTALTLQAGHRRSVDLDFFSILAPLDIAVMKIIAISQRGRKRDFFDLYWICQNINPLYGIISRVPKQYSVSQNTIHILKSLVYFKDAESDPNPEIYFDANWKKVKNFFIKEIPIIAEKLIR